VIDHDVVDPSLLPDESAISAVTLAELAARPHAAIDEEERARRQDRLQWAAATWDPLPFDAEAARMYGRVFAAVRAAGRTSRARLAELLIATTGAANGGQRGSAVHARLPRLLGAGNNRAGEGPVSGSRHHTTA
jgi:predicted nucleic acid-binding protein